MIEVLFWIIFIFIIAGYVFKLFLRYGLPWMLNRFVNKQQKKYTNSFNNAPPNQNKEGEVKVKKTTKKKSDGDKEDFGEYVDFEDLK
jgi:hypothetical protein